LIAWAENTLQPLQWLIDIPALLQKLTLGVTSDEFEHAMKENTKLINPQSTHEVLYEPR